MKIYRKGILLEQVHHNKIAEFYAKRSETDYMWELPSEILLFNKDYIKIHDTVIDFGCGPSTIIRNLIKPNIINNMTYIGVDLSPEMLKLAKKNIPKGKFIVGDMETIKLEKESADVIISLGALHHSLDKAKTLYNWLKILKSGGVILMREPTFEAFKRGEGESPMEEGIKMSEFRNFIAKNNLIIISLYYFNSTIFHIFNRLLIKIGLQNWQKIRILWYPVVYVDILISNTLGFLKPFKGLAFAAIIKKL